MYFWTSTDSGVMVWAMGTGGRPLPGTLEREEPLGLGFGTLEREDPLGLGFGTFEREEPLEVVTLWTADLVEDDLKVMLPAVFLLLVERSLRGIRRRRVRKAWAWGCAIGGARLQSAQQKGTAQLVRRRGVRMLIAS